MEWEHVFLYELDAKLRPLDSIHQRDQRAAVQQEQQNALRHLYVAVTRALDTVIIVAEPHKHSLWSHPDVQQCLDIVNIPADIVPIAIPAQAIPQVTPQTTLKPASAVKPTTSSEKATPTAKSAQPVHAASPKPQKNTTASPQSAYKPLPYAQPTSEEWLEKGHYYRDHDQWKAALKCYQQAGNASWINAMRAVIAYQSGSKEAYKQALTEVKKDGQAYQFVSSFSKHTKKIPTPEMLYMAVAKNDLETILEYIEDGVDVNALNRMSLHRDNKGNDKTTVGYIHAPALYGAIGNNALEAASLLIQAGANVNACVKSSTASLNHSAFKGLNI